MKRIIGAALGIAALVVIGAPLVNGMLMERVIRSTHQEANALYDESGSGASLEITRYDRGYRSSEIEWTLHLGQLNTLYGVEEIRFVDRARHRLTGIESATSLEKNQWYSDLVATHFNGRDPLSITTIYRLTGDIESTIEMAPVSLLVEDEQLRIGPGQLRVTSDSEFSVIRTEASLQHAAADDIALEGLSIDSTLAKISTYIWDGTVQLTIDRGRLADEESVLEVRGFTGTYGLDADQRLGRLSVSVGLAADALQAGINEVKRPLLRLEVNNLDAAGYENYLEAYSDLAGHVLEELAFHGTDHDAGQEALKRTMTMAGIQLLAAGERLLKKDLQIRVTELSAGLPSGEIKGTMNFHLLDDLSFMQLAPLANQPSLAFRLFALKSALSMPAALADDPELLTAPLYPGMPTGLFQRDGQRLVHQAETRDGKLFLNGQEVILD